MGKLKSGKKEKSLLTQREREIFHLLLQEYSNQEIADKLFLSVRTIETHRYTIMNKLRIKDFSDVLAKHKEEKKLRHIYQTLSFLYNLTSDALKISSKYVPRVQRPLSQ